MVSKFFQPKQLDTDGLKAALFRGHLLLGKTIKPPDSFAFYAAKEIQLEGGGDVKTFKIEDAVSSMEVWEYDELPDIRKKSALGLFIGDFGGLYTLTKCKFYECCDRPWINRDVALRLEPDVEERLYGQHIAQNTVIKALKAHLAKS
uniref:FERM domain-containing protein n=1 Tax=Globodera pallida TaxID=36090 RepID=A0A183CH83_GLOPA